MAPTLRPRVEGLDLGRVQGLARDPLDGLARLLPGEGQGVLADLRHLIPEAQAERLGETVISADEDEAHAVRRPFGEQAELVENDGAGQHLEVLDDHRDRSRIRQLGEHDGEEVLTEGGAVPAKVSQGPLSHGRHDELDGLGQPAAKSGGVVGGAGRHPRCPPLRMARVATGPEGPTCRSQRGPRSAPPASGSPTSRRSTRAGRFTTNAGGGGDSKLPPARSRSSCLTFPGPRSGGRRSTLDLPDPTVE